MKIYAWVKNGQLFTTEDKNLAPSDAIVFEVETPNDVILDNGQIRIKTVAEKLAEEKQRKLDQLKQYVATLLSPTDYVVIRISEAQTLGDMNTVEKLKQKYATQLQQRQAIRQWYEQMKQAINNAQSLDKLNSIVIQFSG